MRFELCVWICVYAKQFAIHLDCFKDLHPQLRLNAVRNVSFLTSHRRAPLNGTAQSVNVAGQQSLITDTRFEQEADSLMLKHIKTVNDINRIFQIRSKHICKFHSRTVHWYDQY